MGDSWHRAGWGWGEMVWGQEEEYLSDSGSHQVLNCFSSPQTPLESPQTEASKINPWRFKETQ